MFDWFELKKINGQLSKRVQKLEKKLKELQVRYNRDCIKEVKQPKVGV